MRKKRQVLKNGEKYKKGRKSELRGLPSTVLLPLANRAAATLLIFKKN